ncbi:hypothetical protein TWF192_011213 [Orbilia oligospora]|uniref:Uncharacterized protein n=1 Tax=Orbilia oligospora TaxID=2813651 RepID=A0A6G1LXR6_ORBOL|nr:hypothetical protein TWF191_001463 [Orbilia oligospora]KAF3237047.1 hypothetical protein TWF192_011213 [Orbilia oligospora]KAF3237048.1 hypothetical protein TWF192_011213 [Orbilia oligospora]
MDADHLDFGSPATTSGATPNPLANLDRLASHSPLPGETETSTPNLDNDNDDEDDKEGDVSMLESSENVDPKPKEEKSSANGSPGGDDENADDAGEGDDEDEVMQGMDGAEKSANGDKKDGEEDAAAAAKSNLVQQTFQTIIPSYATWFDMNSISDIERKSLSEFFNNRNRSKTPSIYKDYRDFMVNTYRLNPAEFLTVTACRRNLTGDSGAIMRVHRFLEQWGLINYQVDPEKRPNNVGPPFTGHFRITADTPRGLQPFQPGSGSQVASEGKPLPATEKAAASASTPKTGDVKSSVTKSIYETTGKDLGEASKTNGHAEEPEKRQHWCYSCGVDCTRVRYYTSKSKKIELCPNCFLEGRFPNSFTSADFLRADDVSYQAVDRDAPWSDEETLKLLDAIHIYKDDWNQVAGYVGSRTREQCVLHFLQMPIEDRFLEENLEQLGPLQYDRIPFTQADNPVMSVISFLASLVDPKVAAAAAQSSVQEMLQLLRDKLDESATKPSKSDSEKKTEEKTESTGAHTTDSADAATKSAMDLDEPVTSTAPVKKEKPGSLDQMASVALGVVSARACGLASNEEREVMRLVAETINANLRKIDMKLAHQQELETLLHEERRELEKQKQQLFLDRIVAKRQTQKAVELLRKAHAAAGEETLKYANQLSSMNFGTAPGSGVDGSRALLVPSGSEINSGASGPGAVPPSQIEGYTAYEA